MDTYCWKTPLVVFILDDNKLDLSFSVFYNDFTTRVSLEPRESDLVDLVGSPVG